MGFGRRIRTWAVVSLFCLASSLLFCQSTTLGLNAPVLFDRGMNALLGPGASRSDLIALDSLHRSADLGYAPAQTVLGYLYETGQIVQRDPDQALEWYEHAAGQDDSLAEWLVGRLIYLGAVPPRDLNNASRWLEKSAAHDNPFGEYLLGKILLDRGAYAKAAEQFRKAAAQGLPQAEQQLGMLLKQGRGVDEDKFQAYVFLRLSYDAGNPSAGPDLQTLEADLGSNQVEQAKSRARDLATVTRRAALARGCTGWAGEFQIVPLPPPPELQHFCR